MLRARLFLSLVPFVVILLAIGLYAMALFSRLTGSLDATLAQHHKSLITLQTMGDALTRMDKQILLALARRTNNISEALATQEALFSAGLREQLQDPGFLRATTQIQRLATNYHALQAAAGAILSTNQLPQQLENYERLFLPVKAAMEDSLKQCRRIQYEGLLESGLVVQATGERMKFWMVVGLVAALTISSYACYQIGRSILNPIRAMTRATRELAEDRFERAVPVSSRDELGELAGAFNKMAAQLRAYRQTTSEKILRLHRMVETMLASFPDPIFVFNENRHIELKNPAAEELLARLQPPGRLPEFLDDLIRKAVAAGQDFLPQDFNASLAVPIGNRQKHFLPRIVVMRHPQEGTLLGVALALYDITRFRLMDDAKTNLVATVSHELKTPLTSVRMVLHMLLENALGPLSMRQQDLLRTACDDAERLLRILNNLLDLARLEQGSTELRKERVAPGELIRKVVEEMIEPAATRGLTLRCDVNADLPAISVDPQRVGHVLSNFVTNAIKHSPRGSDVWLRAVRAQNGGVRFSVMDQGAGVPEEFRNRIFDRFFRVPGQEKRGAGLGLSIAREIVLAHAGHIGVRNGPGGGSEFYFVLGADGETTSS